MRKPWYFVTNVLLAVALICCCKYLFVEWPYPITATGLHFVATYAAIPYTVTLEEDIPHRVLGILYAGTYAFANASLKLNTVGTYELLKSSTIPLVLLFQCVLLRVYESTRAFLLAAVVVVCVALGSVHLPYSLNPGGILCALLSSMCAAASKVGTKAMLQSREVDPDALLLGQLPCAICTLLGAGIIVEQPVFPTSQVLLVLLASMALAALLNRTTFKLYKISDPLHVQLLTPIKALLVVSVTSSWGPPLRTACIVVSAIAGAAYTTRPSAAWDEAPQRGWNSVLQLERATMRRKYGIIALVATAGIRSHFPGEISNQYVSNDWHYAFQPHTFARKRPLDIRQYVITMPSRRAHIRRAMRQLNLSWPITYVDAVDTTRWTASNYTMLSVNRGPGVAGCALSHAKVAKEFLHSSHDYALVFEDDLHVPDAVTGERIVQAIADTPGDFSLLYIGHCGWMWRKHVVNNVYYDGGSLCAHAYMMDKRMAHITMANSNAHALRSPDQMLSIVAKSQLLPSYSVHPTLLKQDGTSIIDGRGP